MESEEAGWVPVTVARQVTNDFLADHPLAKDLFGADLAQYAQKCLDKWPGDQSAKQYLSVFPCADDLPEPERLIDSESGEPSCACGEPPGYVCSFHRYQQEHGDE